MKYLLICTIITLATSESVEAQLDIDSLFLSADSLTLIHKGFEEEEIENAGFNQVFCYESPAHYGTNSKALISRTLKAMNFRESEDILFCGYDYEIYGFQQQEQIFKIDYNTECNFASLGQHHFWTDTLSHFTGLIHFLRFTDTICEFRTRQLTDCYVESLLADERINVLSIWRPNELEIAYRLVSKRP